MADISETLKRIIIGSPIDSPRKKKRQLTRVSGWSRYSTNALSSLAYGPDQIFLTLALGGLGALVYSPWIGLGVVCVLFAVGLSYMLIVRFHPSHGGDYQVSRRELGHNSGMAVGASLLVDYVLTLAVSVTAAILYLRGIFSAIAGLEVVVAALIIGCLTLLNLRGFNPRQRGSALVVLGFIFTVGTIIILGVVHLVSGDLTALERSASDLAEYAQYQEPLTGLALVVLVLRSFAAGSVALTGLDAINNEIKEFQAPKAKNAAVAMLGLTVTVTALFWGMFYLADRVQVGILGDHLPVIGQLAEVVFGTHSFLIPVVLAVVFLVLILAGNGIYSRFPNLASDLAKDNYLPRQLYTRGDRLVYSNGILLLSGAALFLVWLFDADIFQLIQLYLVGAFISFTLTQIAMVRFWNSRIRLTTRRQTLVKFRLLRFVNWVGASLSALVLVLVVFTKARHGAWVAILAIALVFLVMLVIHRHYDATNRQLGLPGDTSALVAMPSATHAIVLVCKLNQPSLRALTFAQSGLSDHLEALTVEVGQDETATLLEQWKVQEIPVPLRVLGSPFRDITTPVENYVRRLKSQDPNRLVFVYIPQYVVRRPWEKLLHNQSTYRLRIRLSQIPGVVVASVPWQLG